ncbi:hypothetical protein BDA96_06G128500 [Sorghum bicolor]|uniref:FAS1 domain-containing protein n=2 Tax=Sorghum bicolor TaxID=4558 RepID=A0A921UC55_SORBI|nr:hypothetical protein BDA96_06G128500 [Sorghum bicolor]OQU81766.1 hypothetical protein SORBI_3006G115900 [Sorghum bicolor]
MEPKPAVLAIAIQGLALPRAALSQSTQPTIETPAPAPAPHHVNLTELLSLAGPSGTFLDYLTRTDVIRTFQSQANATTDHDHGHGLSAFSAVDGAALSSLTADQLRTLMLCHGVPRYLPLSSFAALAASGPVPTSAGGCALNVTDAAGRIRVASGWTRVARLVSSVYSTPPVAVYALDRVLLPEQVFPTQPAVAPGPRRRRAGVTRPTACRPPPSVEQTRVRRAGSVQVAFSLDTWPSSCLSGF